MDFVLRCNNLKCRTQLHDRAVVTTCSHVFCAKCADTTGLSRANNANRNCPACDAPLQNADDVVVADLRPSEDYKTSILSGLSPTIIMECASRALAFHSYQAAQEVIYQEHLAKGLTEKYNTLSHQMDQLIHDANSQIKVLQDKVQAQQADQVDLIAKNSELGTQFKEKARQHAQIKRLYDSLKQQQMQSQLAVAAGDEAEVTLRGHRQIDRMPGVRSGTDVYSHQSGSGQCSGGLHPHNRQGSGSSASSGHPRGGFGTGMGPVPTYASHIQGRGHRLRGQTHTGQSAPTGTPQQSRLPVLGSVRQDPRFNVNNGPPFQASPMLQQQRKAGDDGSARRFENSVLGAPNAARRANGPLQR